MKISKPFAKKFNTLLGGEVVSYSPKSMRVAIGNYAVEISKEKMHEITSSSNAYGEKFSLVVSAYMDAKNA